MKIGMLGSYANLSKDGSGSFYRKIISPNAFGPKRFLPKQRFHRKNLMR
jgi:hypothetical protein